MLHRRPDLVQEEQLDGTYQDEPYDHTGQDLLVDGSLSVYRLFEEYTESGAIGDPALASAEKGEEIYYSFGEEMEIFLRKFTIKIANHRYLSR